MKALAESVSGKRYSFVDRDGADINTLYSSVVLNHANHSSASIYSSSSLSLSQGSVSVLDGRGIGSCEWFARGVDIVLCFFLIHYKKSYQFNFIRLDS